MVTNFYGFWHGQILRATKMSTPSYNVHWRKLRIDTKLRKEKENCMFKLQFLSDTTTILRHGMKIMDFLTFLVSKVTGTQKWVILDSTFRFSCNIFHSFVVAWPHGDSSWPPPVVWPHVPCSEWVWLSRLLFPTRQEPIVVEHAVDSTAMLHT